jgi:DNA-binding transcriptional LysR family regulator
MVSPITLDALRTLDAIDRRRTFAAAAEELFCVPSAVSYTISKLEDDLGVRLFDRSRRKAELTAVGRLVLEQGRQILTATDELTAMARQVADGWEAELRICVETLLDCGPVYQLIQAFQAVQPRAEVRLSEEVLEGAWDALNAGRCDLVIGATGEPPGQGFVTHPLGQVEFDFAVAAGHPLAALPQPLRLKDIENYPTVIVTDSTRLLPARSSGLLDGRSRLVVPSMARKIAAQREGLGVGYLPRHRIRREVEAGSLQVLQLEEPRSSQSISVAWRKSSKGKGLKWFVNQLKAARFDPGLGLMLSASEVNEERSSR